MHPKSQMSAPPSAARWEPRATSPRLPIHPTPHAPYLHHTPCALRPSPYNLHPVTYTLHPAPFTLYPTPCTLHPTPCTLHPISYTLYPTPYTLHPTPYTLHPSPYTLHHTPYTLHPTPCRTSVESSAGAYCRVLGAKHYPKRRRHRQARWASCELL